LFHWRIIVMEEVLNKELSKLPLPDMSPAKRVDRSKAPATPSRRAVITVSSRQGDRGDDDSEDDRRRLVGPLPSIADLMCREYVTVSEAERLIPCGHAKLYRLIGEGALELRKLGRRSLIRVASIRRLHAGLPRAAIDRSDRAA
jgi:hypothetical protein